MLNIKGKSVINKIAIGPVKVFKNIKADVKKTFIEDVSLEIVRLEEGLKLSTYQLSKLYEKALESVSENEAEIFEVHKMMLEDDGFLDAIKDKIKEEKVCAEYAVKCAKEEYAELFANMDDEYMQARATDVKDVSDRLINNLLYKGQGDFSLDEPSIIVAYDLSPSETVSLDKSKILGILTVKGSTNSHTAILARTMGVSAIVSADFDLESVKDGEVVILDGFESKAIYAPDEATLKEYEAKLSKQNDELETLKSYIGKETITKSGKKINLFANIGSPSDVDSVLANDAEGIGLFRSEFLYIGRDSAPTEEEQFKAYKEVLERMGDKPVIIRTLDIGADKKADYLGIASEENPAMGLRAIRLCLTNKDIFKTQLRALLRASEYGNLHIMYPMITSVSELDKIDSIYKEVVNEVKPKILPKTGVMIETPAAALISDKLAKRVDFFSIGTNDLTQYTLAMDRQAENLDEFFDPYHEAVLQLIRITIDNAHKEGIWAGICGELAADERMVQTFIEYGVDELSVSPAKLLNIRKTVIS